MAGNFIAWKMKGTDIDTFLSAVPIGSVTEAAHLDVGWNEASRAEVKRLFQNTPLTSREGLPPHKYLELKASTDDATAIKIRNYASSTDGVWIGQLDRRDSVCKSLSSDADSYWKSGNKVEALITELKRGNVSIEYYTMDGKAVTGADYYG
jgi:hypothetical protein